MVTSGEAHSGSGTSLQCRVFHHLSENDSEMHLACNRCGIHPESHHDATGCLGDS